MKVVGAAPQGQAFFYSRPGKAREGSDMTGKKDRRPRTGLVRACGSAVESLEGRRMLSASLADGVLTVNGTAGADTISFELVLTDVVVTDNGVVTRFAAAAVTSIVVSTGAGHDSITGDEALLVPMNVNAGDGNSTIVGGGGNDSLYGNNGVDRIWGGGGDDTLVGGLSYDYFYGGPGADTFVGGASYDEVNYADATVGVSVTLDGIANDGAPGEGDNVGVDCEHITGGAGDDTLVGNGALNMIVGNGGDDWIDGGGGNDSLHGNDGDDTIYGGAGGDSISAHAGNNVVYAGDGADTVSGGAGADAFHGEGGNDSMIGYGGNDSLYGGDGNDKLLGDLGHDVVSGGNDDDTVNGGPGVDTLTGGAGVDSLQSSGDGTVDFVYADVLDILSVDSFDDVTTL